MLCAELWKRLHSLHRAALWAQNVRLYCKWSTAIISVNSRSIKKDSGLGLQRIVWPEIDLTEKSGVVCCSGPTGGFLKEDSLTAHFPWQLFWDKIAKDKVKTQQADTVPSGCGVIVVLRMKMSCRRTAGLTGTTTQRKGQGRGSLRGLSCKTSDHLEAVRPPAQSHVTCFSSLSARIQCWLYSCGCFWPFFHRILTV